MRPSLYFSPKMDPFIAHHLHGVSRTYALLIPMLPAGLRDAVGLAYLLMRIVDTLEDAPQLQDDDRRERLLAMDRRVAALANPTDDSINAEAASLSDGALGELAAERALMSQTNEVLRRLVALEPQLRSAACDCARAMIRGVLAMLERSRERGLAYPGNRDSAELREYCYYVAGVVGEMLCAMMAHHLRAPSLLRLRPLAVELGIGLQLVNILKDARRDSKGGRCYLPLNDEGDVAKGEVYRAVLAEARASLEKGIEFVLALPATARELRSFCGLPIAWGALTLERAEKSPAAAKIARSMIEWSINHFMSLASDDQALRRWFGELLKGKAGTQPALV